MRPVDFPHSNEFVEKIRTRIEFARQQKISDQLTLIATRLSSFDEHCDSDGCLRISMEDVDPFVDKEVLKILENNGWLVEYDENRLQYIFSIKELSCLNEV